jgi:hypothetical protein
MTDVKLKRSEFLHAAKIGVTRQVENKINGRENLHGAGRGDEWRHHILGAVGEMAVAKYLGVYWNGNLGNLGAADVGSLEVRSRSETWHDLILHKPEEGDSPDALFINSIVSEDLFPSVRLDGWIRAEHGQKDKYWSDPAGGRPAYFVPSGDLHPMGEIWSQPEFESFPSLAANAHA